MCRADSRFRSDSVVTGDNQGLAFGLAPFHLEETMHVPDVQQRQPRPRFFLPRIILARLILWFGATLALWTTRLGLWLDVRR